MAAWTSRVVITTTKQFVLPSPTNWAEVRKVLAAIDQELSEDRHWDDTVTVTAHDDEIFFTYLVKNEEQ